MPKNAKQCLSCDRSERQVPLFTLQFAGEQIFICPQCLPALIHAPKKLAGKLPGTESMSGVQRKH